MSNKPEKQYFVLMSEPDGVVVNPQTDADNEFQASLKKITVGQEQLDITVIDMVLQKLFENGDINEWYDLHKSVEDKNGSSYADYLLGEGYVSSIDEETLSNLNFFKYPELRENGEYKQKVADLLQESEAGELQHAQFRDAMAEKGVRVITYKAHGAVKGEPVPDALFLNNNFHLAKDTKGNDVAFVMPMKADNRQAELTEDVIKAFKEADYDIHDLRHHRATGDFLEGTGSMVIHHPQEEGQKGVIFAALSERTKLPPLQEIAEATGYELETFIAKDADDQTVYHTNVMGGIGDKAAIMCLDSIETDEPDASPPETKEEAAARVKNRLEERGVEVVDISKEQMKQLAGNNYEVVNKDGDKILTLSTSAWESMEQTLPGQKKSPKEQLERIYGENIIVVPYDDIQKMGGGTRCTEVLHQCDNAQKFFNALQNIMGDRLILDNVRDILAVQDLEIPTHYGQNLIKNEAGDDIAKSKSEWADKVNKTSPAEEGYVSSIRSGPMDLER